MQGEVRFVFDGDYFFVEVASEVECSGLALVDSELQVGCHGAEVVVLHVVFELFPILAFELRTFDF